MPLDLPSGLIDRAPALKRRSLVPSTGTRATMNRLAWPRPRYSTSSSSTTPAWGEVRAFLLGLDHGRALR